MIQFILTPAAGKRLIAKAVAARADVRKACAEARLVIVAGTTNGYVAEELLASLGLAEGFDKSRFFRGLTLPPGGPVAETGRLKDESAFPGDIVINRGAWEKGKTIFDVADDLGPGDMIIKGANAVDPESRRAGVLVGHPKAGTALAIIQASAGKRVAVLIPVGLEKRVAKGAIEGIAERLASPGGKGLRFLPLPGEVFTETEALEALTGARAGLIAAGGVGGAEGAIWIAATGSGAEEGAAAALLASLGGEIPFRL